MPRNWRCASNHTWAGEMGALLACPECGCTDVYEYRVPGQVDSTQLPPVPPPPGAEMQFAFPPQPAGAVTPPPAPAANDPALDSTSIQLPALGASAASTDTAIMPRPAKAPRRPAPPPPPRRVAHTPLHTPALPPGGQFKETDIFPAVRMPAPAKPAANAAEPSTADLPGESATDPGGTLLLEPPAEGDSADSTLVQEEPSSSQTWAGQAHGTDTDATERLDPPTEGDTGHWAPLPAADGTEVVGPPGDPNSTGEFTAVIDANGDASTGEYAAVPPETEVADPGSAVQPGMRVRPAGEAYADTEERAPAAAQPKPRAKSGGQRAPKVEGYELVGVLGRGGMGVVYKARHLKLGRMVALKMILGGQHAGKDDRERFLLEAESVAKLKHPNIVQIYDIGEHEGLPYFSLEFLDGGSLSERSNGQPMPPKLAAEIVAQLADAMDYAHAAGIVHRDLKPGNVLFQKAAEGGRSGTHSGAFRPAGDVPKVTDFGLAKKLEGDSGITGTGTILGTPSFMSPEQADGRTKEIGPPTDIHALGAILYDLLTGRPPFLGADPMDTIMQVRQLEPVPPTRWVPGVPLDLENVCLKCLQKPVAKRYATAGELADDLRRFLAGEPVLARPAPVWEKAYKWAKRRPTAAAVIGLSALLAAGVVGGSAYLYRVERANAAEESRLRAKADEARRAATAEKVEAERQRDRAAADRKRLRYALDTLLTRVGDRALRDVPGVTAIRKELLDRAAAVYDDALKSGTDADLVREAGWTQQRAGRLREALGEPQEATTAYLRAADLFGKLAQGGDPDDRKSLADTHRQLMALYAKGGRPDDADRAFLTADGLLSELISQYPGEPNYQLEKASLLNSRGAVLGERRRVSEAEDAFRKAMDILGKLPAAVDGPMERARVRLNLTLMLAATGLADKAAAELQTARGELAELTRANPDDQRYALELARAAGVGGHALWQAGRPGAAEEAFRDAAERFARLSAKFPDRLDYKFEWAKQRRNLGMLLGDLRKPAAAKAERAAARELFQALADARPGDAEYRLFHARSLADQSAELDAEGRRPDAIAAAAQAADILGKLAAVTADSADVRLGQARAVANLAKLLARDAQESKAEPLLAEAVALYQDLVKSAGPHLTPELAGLYADQSNVYRALGKPPQADLALKLAAMTYEAIAEQAPDQPDAPAEAARLTAQRALDAVAQPAVAVAHLRDAVKLQRVAVQRFRAQKSPPLRPEFEANLGLYGKALVEAHANEGNAAGAAAAVAELADLPPSWGGWFDVAALLSKAAGKADGDARKASCARAMECLRRAAEGGKLDAARLRESPEFAALREAADTKAEIEKLAAAKPATEP